MKKLYELILTSMLFSSGLAIASQEWSMSLQQSRQQAMVDFLYRQYGDFRNALVSYLPADIKIEEALQVMQARKVAIEESLAGLSYIKVVLGANSKLGELSLGIGALGTYYLHDIAGVLSYEFPSLQYGGEHYSAFQRTVKYGWRGFFAMQAIAGFGLYKDIQAMRDKKNALNAELTKINAIIALLQKAQ